MITKSRHANGQSNFTAIQFGFLAPLSLLAKSDRPVNGMRIKSKWFWNTGQYFRLWKTRMSGDQNSASTA
jgi:hypothetical protein